MHKVVTMTDLYPVMKETLVAGGCIRLTVTGTSMLPMLKHGQDTVVLEPVSGMLHKNDVVLYQRENGQFVLHRIVALEPDSRYTMCGDHQFIREYHISHRQVIGRLNSFIHNGRLISRTSLGYKTYVFLLPVIRLFQRSFLAGGKDLFVTSRRTNENR